MKKLLFVLAILLVLMPIISYSVFSAASSSISSTAGDEAKGKQIWEQLQSNKVNCSSLKDDDYEVLGEYFMGQSIGNTERHAVMNQMMKNMMGEKGEEQMHITLGKRSSGCDTNASLPSGYGIPMMWWMMGGGGFPMMGYGGWGGFGIMGWLTMIIFWILIILGVVVLIRYLGGTRQNSVDKTPLDILKERYARGEINKKEFEDIKKDMSS